tara:strand:+ start:97226 stop:98203 length:978 start_codon:yes stop_codon:yes gene_type:complete
MSKKVSTAELRLIQFLHCLPLFCVMAFATAITWLASWLPVSWVSAHRDVLLNQLICFPERSWKENRRHARRALVQTARTLAGYSHVWLRPEAQAMGRIKEIVGVAAVREAMNSNRPVLFLSLHQAAWEVPVLVIGEIGQAIVMYQPAVDSALDPVVKEARERTGCKLVPADGRGVRTALGALDQGGTFGLLADHQPGGKSNPCADFFGHAVPVPAFVHKVISRYKPAIFYVHAEYKKSDRYYDVHFVPAAAEMYDADEQTTLNEMMKGLEAIIRRAPDQYNWTYNRFRRGAQGKRDWYKKKKAMLLIERIRSGELAADVFVDSQG